MALSRYDNPWKAEAAERRLSEELARFVVKSVIYTSGERDPRVPVQRPPDQGKLYMMGHDPRLARMPDRPTLFDFFTYRFGRHHLMQMCAARAQERAGEKVVMRAWCHDIAIAGFNPRDHGYWGAQLVEPYVDEESAGPPYPPGSAVLRREAALPYPAMS